MKRQLTSTPYTVLDKPGWDTAQLVAPTGKTMAHFFHAEDATYAANCINLANDAQELLQHAAQILDVTIRTGEATEAELQRALDSINAIRKASKPIRSANALN